MYSNQFDIFSAPVANFLTASLAYHRGGPNLVILFKKDCSDEFDSFRLIRVAFYVAEKASCQDRFHEEHFCSRISGPASMSLRRNLVIFDEM